MRPWARLKSRFLIYCLRAFYEREPEVDLFVIVADYAYFAEVFKVISNYFQRSNNDVKKNVDKFRKLWLRYKYGEFKVCFANILINRLNKVVLFESERRQQKK